jgi:hypothetical protein
MKTYIGFCVYFGAKALIRCQRNVSGKKTLGTDKNAHIVFLSFTFLEMIKQKR